MESGAWDSLVGGEYPCRVSFFPQVALGPLRQITLCCIKAGGMLSQASRPNDGHILGHKVVFIDHTPPS